MAYLGRYEGDWQASLLGLTDLPGRPIRRSGGGFRPTVLCRSEAFCPGGLLQSPPCHRQHPPAASTSAPALPQQQPLQQQPSRRSTLPSHVATRPPSPPLESEASEVALRNSYPRQAQSCSWRALTSACPSGRTATPPRDSPADWEMLRGCSDRSVCLSRTRPIASCFTPCPRGLLARTRWHTSGLSVYTDTHFPLVSLLSLTLCKIREEEEQVLLVAPYWPNRTWFPELMLIATAPSWQIPFSERGLPLAPASRLVESPHVSYNKV